MYKDLNGEQQALASLMSDISEEAWAAGWMDGLEYALWYAVLHGPMKRLGINWRADSSKIKGFINSNKLLDSF